MEPLASGKSLMARLMATARENGPKTHRIQDILSSPFRGRHITNFVKIGRLVDGIPLFDAMAFWRIKQEGLRISTGDTAAYGDGAYCLSREIKPPASWHYFVDIEIPTGIAIEQISVQGIPVHYYRFLPVIGDVIKGIKILDTNIPTEARNMAKDFMQGR